MTVPARPSDIEQREGRIIRYGNEKIRMSVYTATFRKKSYDSYQWQNAGEKGEFYKSGVIGRYG